MTIISKPATDAYRDNWEATFGKKAPAAPAPAAPRNPGDVIDAVLKHLPLEYGGLRARLIDLKAKAGFRAPEDQQPTWMRLMRLLQAELPIPPETDWQKRISDIVEGRRAD